MSWPRFSVHKVSGFCQGLLLQVIKIYRPGGVLTLRSIQQRRDSTSCLRKYVLCVNLIHLLSIGKCALEERPQVARTPKGNRNEMQVGFSR